MIATNIFLAVSLISVLFFVFSKMNSDDMGFDDNGEYFAEVYLVWYFGEGSIMWRQRFRSAEAAEVAVKKQAKYLDEILPKYYIAEYQDGTKYNEPHEFGINFRVGRSDTRTESGLTPINRTSLPGSGDNKGSSKLMDSDFYEMDTSQLDASGFKY